ELPLGQQAKFLRLLENHTYRRVGGVKTLTCSARFLAATNRDLSAQVKKGSFRSDLYFRLTPFVIEVPPLRERREDIPLLARHLLDRTPHGRQKEIAPEAISLLLRYDWPGNVRELANALERATILAQSSAILEPKHFAFLNRSATDHVAYRLEFDHFPTIAELEAQVIRDAKLLTNGRPKEMATLLGISERHAYRLLKQSDTA
ncbi:MAG TPA: sigma 54-interacting transcriptional regulator, partial [Hydrogenophilus thermoluteolus]|nr:sigma 54-interacting transcriptional regulator [Hydrogenophilus thermoluteolus]